MGADVSGFIATCLQAACPSPLCRQLPVVGILLGCCSRDGECHQILKDGATLCYGDLTGWEGSIRAAHPSASLSPVPYCPLPEASWRVGPCTRARSRRLCWLRVSLRGAAESAACTSAARDPPEDDINQCFSPGLWQPPCARSCACALGNKAPVALPHNTCLLGVAPCPQGLLGRWGQMCPPLWQVIWREGRCC